MIDFKFMQSPAVAKELCGAVLADKPVGMPSAKLVDRLRRELRTKKIGHTGILDRAASGLMLLLIGRATAFAEFFLHADKGYVADFHFGTSTDTHDREGSIIEQLPLNHVQEFLHLHREKLETIISDWIQLKEQRPPVYSALKQGGQRLSDHARLGRVIEPQMRPVRIYETRLLRYEPREGNVQVYLQVSGGTYVRSLARDLGDELGIPVHLGALRRVAVGTHQLDDTAWQPEKNEPRLVSAQEALVSWPRLMVRSNQQAERIVRGIALPLQHLEGRAPTRIYQNFFIEDKEGRALAWVARTTGGYRYRRVLV